MLPPETTPTTRPSPASRFPPAANGDEHRCDVGHVLGDLEPDGAVAGHDVHIADWMNEARRLQWPVAMRCKHVPPFGVGQGDDFRAEALDRLELCARRAFRDD